MTVPSFDIVGGYKFPAVGLGTFTVTDEKELEAALDAAVDAGYRHIDTAYLYGNEHIIGKALKKWFDSGKFTRNDIFITTKLPSRGVHPDRVERFLKESLEKLQLDFVDLYLIHLPICSKDEDSGIWTSEPEPTDLIGTWKKLEEQVDLGRTKSIGVSNFNKEQVERILKNARIKPAANQVELNVHIQQPELVKYCQDKGIIVTSYFSLGNPGMRKWAEQNGRTNFTAKENPLENSYIKNIASKYKKSPGQILLKFLVQKNIAVIPKSTNADRIKDNINLFDFELNPEDMELLASLDKGEAGRRNILEFDRRMLVGSTLASLRLFFYFTQSPSS